VPGENDFLAGLGIPLPRVFDRFTDDAAEQESMVQAYLAYSREHHDRLVRAYPGVIETLRGIVERGDRVAVVTSKGTQTARHGAEITGIAEWVEVLVGRDCVTVHKPDPHPFQHALSLLGGARGGRAVVVGDSPRDLEAGRRGGFVTAAALWGPFSRAALEPESPNHWLEDPRKIGAI